MKQDCVKFFTIKTVAAHHLLCYQSSSQLFLQLLKYIKSFILNQILFLTVIFQVDLKCITVGSGGFYYKTHLPKLGQNPESLIIPHSNNSVSRSTSDDPPFEVGQRVRVLLGVDTLRDMQEGHGGWNDKMEEVCEM